jgi:hypothetical protein
VTDSESPARHQSGSEKRRRAHLISIRLDEDERAELARRADATGITIAAYVRERSLDTPPPRMRPRPTLEIRELARLTGAIGKIGANLNQIAKWANADKAISAERAALVEKFRTEMRALMAEVRKAMGREP